MGSELSQYQKRMSFENWQYVLDMLIDTCDMLKVIKKTEALVKNAKVEKHLKYDIYKDDSAGNVIGKIRHIPLEPPSLKSIIENYTGTTKQLKVPKNEDDTSDFMLKFGIDNVKGSVLPKHLLGRLPESWTETSISNTKDVLLKMKEESEYFHEVRYDINGKQKDDIFPPTPTAGTGENYGQSVAWTAFGHFSRTREARRKVIDDYVINTEGRALKDLAIIYNNKSSNIVARIIPKEWKHALNQPKDINK